MRENKITNAIAYATENFSCFKGNTGYEADIQSLMSSLVFTGSQSPYSHIYSESEWNLLIFKAISYYCEYLKLPSSSTLSKIMEVSITALNKLNSIDVKDFTNELPCEIELDHKFIYHSIFYCPIAKEICINDNIPILLGCGHMISKNAFDKIIKNLIPRSTPKCPTCMQEITNSTNVSLY